MAELLIFFILVLRGYTGQWGDVDNHLEKWPTQNEFHDTAVTWGRSTISESAPLDVWDRGSSWGKHMSYQPPRGDDYSKAVLITDNLQPFLKLTNWEGKERAKHKPSLAPWGLCAIIPSSQLTEVQSATKWGLSKEVLTGNETTCLDPQRTDRDYFGGELQTSCFRCQLPWGIWWPEIFTKIWHSPGQCLTVGLPSRRQPQVDDCCKPTCDTHWKDSALSF